MVSAADVLYAGVDVGASRTKAALLDASKRLIGFAVTKSGTDFSAAAQKTFDQALQMAGASALGVLRTVSTGYGRKNVLFAHQTKTEIGCHARGCFLYFPTAITIIDIGGQDNKVIKLDDAGRRINFKMNRK